MPGGAVRTAVRVRYAETDQMGVAHHAAYFSWMEVARVAYCDAAGCRYRSIEREHGVFLAVSEASCRYRVAARFDDELVVSCWVTDSRSRSVRFSYEVHRGGTLIATGETRHVVTDAGGRAVRMPEALRRYFRPAS